MCEFEREIVVLFVGERTHDLSPLCLDLDERLETILFTGGTVIVVLVIFSLLLLCVLCCLGCYTSKLKRRRRHLDLSTQPNTAYGELTLHERATDDLNRDKAGNSKVDDPEHMKENTSCSNTKEDEGKKLLVITHEDDGDYNTLQHNFTTPAEVPNEQKISTVATIAPPMPLLDDYSTISDVLAASSSAAAVLINNIPAYEEVQRSPLPLRRDNDVQDNPNPEGNSAGSHAGCLTNEIPLYSEVNLESKRSGQTLDQNEGKGVKQEVKESEAAGMEGVGEEIPLYSVVNLELKKSREALDQIEEPQEGVKEGVLKVEESSLDDVINDITKWAEELPLLRSPTPPPVPPQLELSTSPPKL